MCTVCGCGNSNDHEHSSDKGHIHSHSHEGEGAGVSQERIIQLEADLLGKNKAYADQNRALLAKQGVLALNLVSSPGSGKTTLLVETLKALSGCMPAAVIEGDQQTSNDANRIRETGAPAVQINTGKGCHLDAHMVGHAFENLPMERNSVLFIENVGNLICPAAFDLGEALKIVILSVTEGEDKPLKYPDIFAGADLMLLTKTDLLPYVDFDVATAVRNAHRINHKLEVLQVSARTGEGLESWLDWLKLAHKLRFSAAKPEQAAQ